MLEALINSGVRTNYPNGYTLSNGEYVIYIPNEINSSTNMFEYSHGGGGYQSDIAVIQDYVSSNNPDSIIIMTKGWWQNSEVEEVLGLESEIAQEFNVSTDSTIRAGFSAGGKHAINTTLEYIRRNPDSPPQTITLLDASAVDPEYGERLSNENIQLLVDNNTTVLAYERGEIHPLLTDYASNDVKVVVITSAGNHVSQNFGNIHNGVIEFSSLKTSQMSNNENYTYHIMDPETKTWKIVTAEEAMRYTGNNNVYLEGIKKRYGYLTQLGALDAASTSVTQLSASADSSVLSNYNYVVSAMNNLRNSIKSTSFLSSLQSFTFTSTTKMPAIIQVYLYDFYKETAELLEKLAAETQTILGIGESIQSVDEQLTAEVGVLTTLAASALPPTTTGSYTPTSSSSVVEPTIVPSETVDDQVEMPTTGSDEPKVSVGGHATNPTLEVTRDDDFPTFKELYSTNNRRVFGCEDGSRFIVNYENGKATSIEYYYDFNTSTNATNNIGILTQKYGSMENYKNISQSNNYVKVSFDASKYSNMSINEICKKFTHQSEIIRV